MKKLDDQSYYARILNLRFLPLYLRKFIIILTNWVFHGMLYMDSTERMYSILLELITYFIVYSILINISGNHYIMLISFLISHTLNWITNGHVYVLFKNLKLISTNKKNIILNMELLSKGLHTKKYIIAAVVYGSIARGELNEHSDLDVRLIRNSGIINGLYSFIFILLERTKAFKNSFPLDIYVLDDYKRLKNMRSDEMPLILYDPHDILKNNLDSHVSLTQWKLNNKE